MPDAKSCPYCRWDTSQADASRGSDGDLLVEHIDEAHDGTNRLVEGRLAELVYPEEAVRT